MKNVLAAVMAAVAVSAPALAEVQSGTPDLIRAASDYVAVSIDVPVCEAEPNMAGSYNRITQHLVLCTSGGEYADANDHDTVRHEVWHLIQDCLTEPNEPYIKSVIPVGTNDWDEIVMDGLSPRLIQAIKDNYPEEHWNAEFEAYAMADALTATQITKHLNNACTPE